MQKWHCRKNRLRSSKHWCTALKKHKILRVKKFLLIVFLFYAADLANTEHTESNSIRSETENRPSFFLFFLFSLSLSFVQSSLIFKILVMKHMKALFFEGWCVTSSHVAWATFRKSDQIDRIMQRESISIAVVIEKSILYCFFLFRSN